MRILAALPVAALLAVVCASPGRCQEKITVDPNANRPAVETPEPKVDERLLKPVTISARYRTVSGIVAELAKSAGVRLLAGSGSMDWQTRSRKLHVYAKDIPLNHLMDSIARVTGFKWKITEGKDGPTYRLVWDPKAIQDAQALLEKQGAQWQEDQAEVRRKAVAEYVRIADLDETQIDDLKLTNPYLYGLATNPFDKAVCRLIRDMPEVRLGLEKSDSLCLQLKRLPEPIAASIIEGARACAEKTDDSGATEGILGPVATKRMAEKLLRSDTVSVYLTGMGNRTPSEHDLRPLVRVLLRCDNDDYLLQDFLDPEDSEVQAASRQLLEPEPEGDAQNSKSRHLEAEREAAHEEYMSSLEWGRPMPEHEEIQAIKERVKSKLNDARFEDSLRQLAEDSSLAVVCDDWTAERKTITWTEKDAPLEGLLDALSSRYGRVWDVRGAVVEMRDRLWVKKLGCVLPETIPPGLVAHLDNQRYIDLAELAPLMGLNHDQVANLAREPRLEDLQPPLDPYLDGAVGTVWASLTDLERKALLGGQAIDVSLLRDRCLKALEEFQVFYPSNSLSDGPGTLLRITRKPNEKGKGYTYSVVLSDPKWEQEEKLQFTTPSEKKKLPAGSGAAR